MLVEIKKVKITKSIFNQIRKIDLAILNSNQYLEENIISLGWVFADHKYVLLQNKENKDLYKWLVMQTICIDHDDPKRIDYSTSGRFGSRRFLSEQEATNFFRTVLAIQKDAKVKGQLFI